MSGEHREPRTGCAAPDPRVAAEVRAWLDDVLGPVVGHVGAIEEVAPDPSGRWAAFVGTVRPDLERVPVRRVHLLDVTTGAVRAVGEGEDEHGPCWSVRGDLAWASDASGTARPVMLRAGGVATGEGPVPVDGTAPVAGVLEGLAWSPDGRRLLLAVAEVGADVAGAHGSGTLGGAAAGPAPGAPDVDDGAAPGRRLLVLDVATGETRPGSVEGTTVWEASWRGPDRLLAVVSTRADEGGWYDARVVEIGLDGDRPTQGPVLDHGGDQVGSPAGSPDGERAAAVRGIASDRGFVQGEPVLLHAGAPPTWLDSLGTDVVDLHWRSPTLLTFAGVRDLDSVVGEIDVVTGEAHEIWAGAASVGGGLGLPRAHADADGRYLLSVDGHDRPPQVAAVGAGGTLEPVYRTGHDRLARRDLPAWRSGPYRWTAPDGLSIHGLLSVPDWPSTDGAPLPLVVHVHGGPVAPHRDRWLMRDLYAAALLARGYAVLQPNPRGSSGRGQDFIARVRGDMNGADGRDILAGIDALVADGIADPARVGLVGGSYGGNMSAWLVTQDQRFAAAVPMYPHTDFVSFHFTTNIPEFDQIFLDSDPLDPAGRHVTRSPLRHVDRVRTPVLQIVGGLDRCCPPEQALQLHRALLQRGRTSVLVTYPQEGHGVRATAAVLDCTVRVVDWFERHMPSGAQR